MSGKRAKAIRREAFRLYSAQGYPASYESNGQVISPKRQIIKRLKRALR